jgi:dephospho-CoA kinase
VLFQIDGLSGTGKTTLSKELTRRGLRAVDTDPVFGYSGDPVTGEPTDSGRRSNWLWDGDKLRAFARACGDTPVFLCGGAMNQDEFADLFEKRFVLHVDSDTMRHRLLTRTNNDYGKAPEELAEQLELNTRYVEEATRVGATIVDATRPISVVADEVVRVALGST